MCKKCSDDSCTGCNNGISPSAFLQMQATVALMQAQTRFLAGHPILALDEPSDIALFDFTVGTGSGIWLGWSICNGGSYPSPTGLINTPDLRDRFLTGAYGNYTLGQVGGENTHTLVEAELPVVSYTVNDPGHTHTVNDPGHTHTVNDPGHVHVAVALPHSHSFTTNSAGNHNHTLTYQYPNPIDVGAIAVGPLGVVMYKGGAAPPVSVSLSDVNSGDRTSTTSTNGAHVHTGTTDAATVTVNISSATTGIVVVVAETGITNEVAETGITINNTGNGDAHENRPPFYACLFIKKIF